MNVRDTSAEAYRKVTESGLLSRNLTRTFDIIYKYGPLTGRQAYSKYRFQYGGDGNLNLFKSHITHLQDYGVVSDFDKVKDEISGMTVYRWDITYRIPVKPNRKTKKERIADALITLEHIRRVVPGIYVTLVDDLKHQIKRF
jgi:hypothetical protein